MLAFVTPVRHAANSRSFERVGRLLDATVRSVCRQTDDRFHVFVVCNERPPGVRSHSRVTFVEVAFPPPGPGRADDLDYASRVQDKATKHAIGVSLAADAGASHVMLIDADDYLHRGLAELANATPEAPGWFSPDGYFHTAGLRYVHAIHGDYHERNGSTSIVRTDLIGVPPLDPECSVEDVRAAVSPDVMRVLAEHGKWGQHLEAQGHAIEPMPFPSSIWEVGHGENSTGNLVSGRRKEPIDASISEAFGLHAPGRAAATVRLAKVAAARVTRRMSWPARTNGLLTPIGSV